MYFIKSSKIIISLCLICSCTPRTATTLSSTALRESLITTYGTFENTPYRETTKKALHQILPTESATITLLDTPEPCAFAVPPREILLCRGVFEKNLSLEELSFLLAHEWAHLSEAHYQHGEKTREDLESEADDKALIFLQQAGIPKLAAYGAVMKVDPYNRKRLRALPNYRK